MARKRIIDSSHGPICGCGTTYAVDVFSDGSVRYEFECNGQLLESRTVASMPEFEVACTLFEEAFHGLRH